MATDTSEKGLETLIVRHMTGTDGLPPVAPVGTGSGPTTDVAARPASVSTDKLASCANTAPAWSPTW